MIRFATWVNTWLPAYGWAVWFYHEYRQDGPDGPFVKATPMRMRLGRYPDREDR